MSNERRHHKLSDLFYCTSHLGSVLVSARFMARSVPALKGVVTKFGSLLSRYTDWRTEAFDRQFGTDTCHRVDLACLGVQEETGYELEDWQYGPVNQEFFHEMIRNVGVNFSNWSFLDVGSGKGKALLLATQYPFRRIIGVEFCEQLSAVAEENVRKFEAATGKTQHIELVTRDFMSYEIPAEPLVVLFNNPFPLSVADRAIGHIEEALERHPCPMFVIYRKAPADVLERLDRSPALTLVRSTPFWRIYGSRRTGIKVPANRDEPRRGSPQVLRLSRQPHCRQPATEVNLP